MICSRLTSRLKFTPKLFAKLPAVRAQRRKWQAVFRLCATASTQGQDGMELSLFSRDVIAMSTAISLSHDVFDAALYLGVCDKIVPGLLIGALQFGHIPGIFVPAGPMPSGLPNAEKARIRQLFAEGKVGRKELLKAESESYHSPGTCTFLRHGQLQSNAYGGYGATSARRRICQPGNALTRSPDTGRNPPRPRDHT